MSKRVLITGGAGFIGSHVADELIKQGYRVRALDNLSEQVHGQSRRRPDYLDSDIELIEGDIRDPETVAHALQGVDAVFHFAAAVGVGQSMYEIAQYTETNNFGTAVLLEQLAKQRVEKLVLASSMSLYGEGLYQDASGAATDTVRRSRGQLREHRWEPLSPSGEQLTPVPTPESKPADLASIYALSKFDQERMCLLIGEAYDIPTTALRFFNVYGPRQALSNPYTGVLAIFASRYLNGQPPLIFEDGEQRRDFVSVHDVSRAARLALEANAATGRVFNIGSGQAYTVSGIARRMAQALNCPDIEPQITGDYRVGDIRHCFADIALAEEILGYRPQVDLEDGLQELADWLPRTSAIDRVPQAREELTRRGLSL
ncbi:nucleoside-diphosphate-sugar epimerase [Alkalilimnicola ehrlichii]|uniref:Nucleoside-diphosphate-sugar epimerase n=1 Tax=Alkalilimnicola ehrlichii TaxID=351052 RepID=A0A3E0WHV4_9GAMM|nr:SDR family NAD(P)-dependent oxidoreductase [Alkalilimnicola ehrlichii]RFA25385.1 nucleoside-diphosphate-sugar epimerase [Alkalilimnicola ehrlichii]RFA32560.1 nucleoside-diphosphate-sugar epimerase [Alkalilimnicola ehrlichii]